jgi:hypothetical protein
MDTQKKKWGPYRYFLIGSSILILVICGVIIFGGRPTPQRAAEIASNGRVFLFMVDGALKRYAHYEGNVYPERLPDLVSQYLAFKHSELFHLEKLYYEKDPYAGYWLSLVNPDNSEMKILLSAKGIEHLPLATEGIK